MSLFKESPFFQKRAQKREQKKFKKLSPEEKKEVISDAQSEALKVEERRMREVIRSGKRLGEEEALFLARYANCGGAWALASLIDGFENLSPETARFLIKYKEARTVIMHPEKFGITIDDYWLKLIVENGGSKDIFECAKEKRITINEELLETMIRNGDSWIVVNYSSKLGIKISDHLIEVIAESGALDVFLGNAERWGIVLGESWARFAIKQKGLEWLFPYLREFKNISEEIANELFGVIENKDQANSMLLNAHVFDFTFGNSWAAKMIAKGYLKQVIDNIEVFKDILGETAYVIMKETGLEFLIRNESSFKLSEEYCTSKEFRQLIFNEIKTSVAQGRIRYFGQLISGKHTRLTKEMLAELYSQEITDSLPQNISFEDLLGIYEFDESGRAKLKKEYEEYVKSFSRNVDQRSRKYLVKRLGRVKADDDGNSERVADILNHYYAEQGAAWFEFENNPDRLVKNQSLDKRILFLHQMSIMSNDGSYSRFWGKEEDVAFSDTAYLNVALEPALSTSFKKFNTKDVFEVAHQRNGAGGLILGGGRIMMAFDENASTRSDGFDAKYSDMDLSEYSNIHEDIESRMEQISHPQKGFNKSTRFNEVILNRPKVCGVFLYSKKFPGVFEKERIRIAQETAQKIGVPLFVISQKGNIRIMGEDKNLEIEEVLSNTLELTEKQKQQLLQRELIESGRFNERDIEEFIKRARRLEIDNDRIIRDAKRLLEEKGIDIQEINRIARENEIGEKDFWNLISLQMNSGKKAEIEDLFEIVNGKMEAKQSFMDEIEKFKKSL